MFKKKKWLTAAIGAMALQAVSETDTERPNIVLLIGDDMSPDFGCFGGPVHTPNIDRLAADGLRFENAYVAASSCSPSRSSIITGRYPHNHGAPELHIDLPEGQFLFPQALKDSGYYCVQSGKWHMGDYAEQAFHHVYKFEGAPDPGREGRWVRCLQERPKNQPFFAWFSAFDAHRPWEPDPEAPAHDPAGVVLPAGIPDTPLCRQDLASYYDEIQRFDRYVGKVVDELKRQGVFENTLVMIFADNGRPFPRSKTSLYDNGMKTPLIVHWPNGPVAEGAVSESLASAIDLAPTLLEIAGLPVPPQVQGVSLLPVLENPSVTVREYVFGERNWHLQRACGRMVRWKNYVYIRDFTPGCYSFQMVDSDVGTYAELLRLKAEGQLTSVQAETFSTNRVEEMLFNVSSDPQQIRNLADNPERRDLLNQFRSLLAEWQDQTGDSIPAVQEMTPDRHDRQTFERLYPGRRPPSGVLPGQTAGATEINNPGVLKKTEGR